MAKWAEILHELTQITAPSVEPISTAEAKSFLRVDHASQDTLIDELIKAARQRVESDTARSLVHTTWDLWFDAFPDGRAIALTRVPLVSVTHVISYNDNDTAATFASAGYLVDTIQGRVALNDGEDWPTDLRTHNSGVIRFVAGYGASASDVPQPLRLALYQLIAHSFEHADPVSGGDAIDRAYTSHIAAYRYAAGIA